MEGLLPLLNRYIESASLVPFYPAYIFELLKSIGEKLRTVGSGASFSISSWSIIIIIIIRAASFIIIPCQQNFYHITTTSVIATAPATTAATTTANRVLIILILWDGRNKYNRVPVMMVDDDFSIRNYWRYDRPITKKLIRIDLKEIFTK